MVGTCFRMKRWMSWYASPPWKRCDSLVLTEEEGMACISRTLIQMFLPFFFYLVFRCFMAVIIVQARIFSLLNDPPIPSKQIQLFSIKIHFFSLFGNSTKQQQKSEKKNNKSSTNFCLLIDCTCYIS